MNRKTPFKHISMLLLLTGMAVLSGCFHSNDSSTPTTYSIGGTVSGLSGTLVLQNNGGNDLSLTQNGTFNFSTTLSDGTNYSVTVLTHPVARTAKSPMVAALSVAARSVTLM